MTATYNKQNYNRGKYNVSSANVQPSGFVSLAAVAEYAAPNVFIDAPKTSAEVGIKSSGRQTSVIFAPLSVAEITANPIGDGVLEMFADCADVDTTVTFAAHGENSTGLFAVVTEADMRVESGAEATRRLFGVIDNTEISIRTLGRQTSDIFAPLTLAEISVNAVGEGVLELFGSNEDSECNFVFSANGESFIGMFAAAATTEMSVHSNGTAARGYFAAVRDGEMLLSANGKSARAVFAKETAVSLEVSGGGAGIRGLFAGVPSIINDIKISTSGASEIYGYAVIALPGLVLPVNGEIVIDTELMTVTLNGQDVTRYFSPESEFFKLKPGENLVLYEDGVANRNVNYKILWKDLYL